MTSSGCHIRQCDHGFYLSIKVTTKIAIIFDLKQFSTKNFSFLTFLSQRRLPYTKNLPIAKNAARNSELMTMTMLQVYWISINTNNVIDACVIVFIPFLHL